MKMPRRPRTVLFLIADTGAGHRSAANAIHRAMQVLNQHATARPGSSGRRDPGWNALIVDVFADCSRFPLRKGVFLYGPAIKYSPRLYGQIFRITNSSARFNTARRLCQPFLREGLRELFDRTHPDLIVSVHPLLNHVALQVLRDMRVRVPFYTVVTDLVSVHCAWLAPKVDGCIVPTENARELALEAGVPPKRIHLLGMPIDPAFAEPAHDTREERRAALGLDPRLPAILLVGGGEGAGGLAEAVRALRNEALPAQLLVVTGRNRQLYEELERERETFHMPLHLFGFVQNMPELMRAADVVVTKAGPGTICEAVACELPILLTGAVPGQEEGNVDYVLGNALGELADTSESLINSLRELLDAESSRLAEYRENARHHTHARASLDIARLLLAALPPASTPSVWVTRRRRSRPHPARTLAKTQQILLPHVPHVPAMRPGPRIGPRLALSRYTPGHGLAAARYREIGRANLARVQAMLRRA